MPKRNTKKSKMDAAILAKKLEEAGHDCIEEILKLLPQVKPEEALKTNLKLMAYLYAKPKAMEQDVTIGDSPLVVRLVKYTETKTSQARVR